MAEFDAVKFVSEYRSLGGKREIQFHPGERFSLNSFPEDESATAYWDKHALHLSAEQKIAVTTELVRQPAK